MDCTLKTDDPVMALTIRELLVKKRVPFQESAGDIAWEFFVFFSKQSQLDELRSECERTLQNAEKAKTIFLQVAKVELS
jgi:hypothetical protein